jgi:carbamoyl-phosphate synthase large subunit
MSAPRRLIVGSAGGTNAFGAIRSVRDRYSDRVFVVAIDANAREHVAATVLADAFVQVPPARSPEFIVALRDLAHSYPGACYLPLHDEEIVIAARLAAEGRFPAGLALIAASYEVVRVCWDKWETHRWLMARGLPSPETALATPAALDRMRQPVLLKPREGTGGENFLQVRSASELADVDPSEWMLQELLQTPQVTVEGFLARRGDFFRGVTREFLERKQKGPTRKARVYDDPELTGIAERLAREMPLFGAFNFEAMRDSAGAWRIIDLHPRLSAGTRMCAAVGVDIAAADLADFWGENVTGILPPLDGVYYVARQYEEYVTSRPQPTARPT